VTAGVAVVLIEGGEMRHAFFPLDEIPEDIAFVGDKLLIEKLRAERRL